MAFKFLFLLGEATEFGLSHFHIAAKIYAVVVIAFSGTQINLTHATVLRTVGAFLNHSVFKDVDKVGEFETTNSAVTLRTDSC